MNQGLGFENIHFMITDGGSLMVAVKDREIQTESRYVLATMSVEDVKKLKKFLNQFTSSKSHLD